MRVPLQYPHKEAVSRERYPKPPDACRVNRLLGRSRIELYQTRTRASA